MTQAISSWYQKTKLGEACGFDTHCLDCQPNGDCESCFSIDGRDVSLVSDYASTCDGDCQELTHHEHLTMDPETQLGYCYKCIPKLPPEIRKRLLYKDDFTD